MNRIRLQNSIPLNSIINKGFDKFDYCDCFYFKGQTELDVDQVTARTFKSPTWVDALMRFRNWLVKPFGLKTEGVADKPNEISLEVGKKAGYFMVIDRNAHEIVMAEDDKHLNFRTSVFLEEQDGQKCIYLTTLVKFNNIWGRLYFLPVKPFHKIIIRSMLKKVKL